MKRSSVFPGSRMAVLVRVALICLAARSLASAQTPGRTLYVDGSLAASCNAYSMALRNCTGQDGSAYTTIQAAANVVVPGDRVLIRGGIYPLISSRAGNVLSRSGTVTQPISFEGYGSEKVIVRGIGFEDRDLNGDGYPDGPADKGTRSALIDVTGSFIQVRKIEVELGPYMGVRVDGSDNVIEEVTSRDNWLTGIWVRGARNKLRYVEAHHNRHDGGIGIARRPRGPEPTDNEISRSLSYHNGREPNDQQVRPIPGDPVGGGNADGFGSGKSCFSRTRDHACRNERIVENIAWRNIDDGFDVTLSGSWVSGNVSIENGPSGRRGIKVLGGGPGQVFSGNVVIGLGIQYRAFELRGMDMLDVFHNLALNSVDRGIYIVSNIPNSRMQNNVGYHNRGDIGSTGVKSNNWTTCQGDPHLVNVGATINLTLLTGTVQQRWQYVMNQVVAAYSPQPNSPLIDAGLLVPGFHCPLADDKGQDPAAACRHWMGAAPDVGPFEFGILGNPDKR